VPFGRRIGIGNGNGVGNDSRRWGRAFSSHTGVRWRKSNGHTLSILIDDKANLGTSFYDFTLEW
jgi:hypothetical protein